MSARFTIRRHSPKVLTPYPWVLRDTESPSFLGQYASHAAAIAAVSARLRHERGLAPALDLETSEIREAMQRRREEREPHPAYRHTMSPCIVEPVIVDESESTA